MRLKIITAAIAVILSVFVLAGFTLHGPPSGGVYNPGAPKPPAGYKVTYAHNFVTQGMGDWVVQPGDNAPVTDSTKPGAQFGLGVKMTAVSQWGQVISSDALVGPSSFVQALVYIPSGSGFDGMGRSYPAGSTANWPAFWTTGNPWPQNGEIDALEGIRGQSQFHGFYGPSSAQKISTPNFNATPNSIGVGWITITFLRTGGEVTAWYGSHQVGTFSFPPTANEKLIFQNQSYSTSVCGNCFGPTLLGDKSTAWLSRVTVYSKR